MQRMKMASAGFAGALMVGTALGTILIAAPAMSQTGPTATTSRSTEKQFNIAPQSLQNALTLFGQQAGIQVSVNATTVRTASSLGVSGRMSPRSAIERLLSGTGLPFSFTSSSTVVIGAPQQRVDAGPADATVLETIVVAGQGATTEGSGSYTTTQMNTATGLPLSIKETPQAVTVVTRQQIDDQQARSLTEILRGTTGVSEGALDSERSVFSYRGFDVDSYQYDGVPTTFNSAFAGGESDLDSIIYDRVEIVRGATGLMTGAGNPGASVNLVRKRAKSTSVTGEVTASAGSWDNFRTTVDLSTPLNSEGTVRGRFVAAGQMGDSFIDRYEKKKGVLYGTVEADLTVDTTLRIGTDYQVNRPTASTWGGALGTGWFSNGEEINWPRSFNGAPDWSRWNSTAQTQFVTLDHNFDNGWEGQVGYTHSRQEYDAKMGMSIGGLIDPSTWTSSATKVYSEWYEGYREQHTLNAKLDGTFDLFGRSHEITFGGSSSWQNNYGTVRKALFRQDYTGSLLDWDGSYSEPVWGDRTGQLDNSTRQVGLYSAARFDIADPLKIIVGARYTNYRNDLTDTYNVVSPYAGAVFDVTNAISVYASYTDIFQPQDEQDKNGDYLDPLQGSNYEVGVKGAFFDDRLNASFSVFLTKQDNIAEADLDGLVPGSGAQAYYGVDGTESKGFEIELGGEIIPDWNIKAGYSRFNIKDPDGAELNTATPRQTFNLFSTYQFSGALEKLTVGGGLRWQSGVWATVWGADGSGDIVQRRAEQGAYTVVNLMARYDFTDQTALQLNVNNIFDEHYFSQVNFYSTRNYGDPRNFTVKLTHKF